ncbi:hypothetical protein [Micrococcus yunnanensis]|uniref:hypothetical protein n=1 Tax=Micrococcus yunnanensis TaxID=566027 RepID=UPI001F3C04FE|nr:hypothetical protein [Micrococcus yunnanensis]MCF8559949.1 hypothetical protein [Micrococcus yunnanensis]
MITSTPAQRAARSANGKKAAAVSIAAARERAAARLDDLEFLAAQGTNRAEAARRAGFPSVPALERFLSRHGRADLRRALPADCLRLQRTDLFRAAA